MTELPPTSIRDRVLLGMALRTLAAFCWAVVAGLVKWAHEQGADLLQILFFRNAGAFLVVAALVMVTAGPSSLRTTRLPAHFRRGVIGICAIALQFYALTLLPLTESIAIGFTAPLFVVALSVPFLKERVTPLQWGAVLVGFAGVLVMIRPDPAQLATFGAIVALGAALGGAGSTLTVRDLGRTERGPTIVFYFLLFASLISAAPLPFVWRNPTPELWIALTGIGVVSAALQLLLTQSLKLAPAAMVSPLDYSQMVWAALIAWLVWNEQLRAATAVGGLIVAGSGLFILWTEHRRPKAPAR